MPYVSARYAPPPPEGMMGMQKEGVRAIIATDDQGVEWHLTDDSQVGDWLRFCEAGGTVRETIEEPSAKPAPEPTAKRKR